MEYNKELDKYLIKYANKELDDGNLTKEELPYVLNYWRRINRIIKKIKKG